MFSCKWWGCPHHERLRHVVFNVVFTWVCVRENPVSSTPFFDGGIDKPAFVLDMLQDFDVVPVASKVHHLLTAASTVCVLFSESFLLILLWHVLVLLWFLTWFLLLLYCVVRASAFVAFSLFLPVLRLSRSLDRLGILLLA